MNSGGTNAPEGGGIFWGIEAIAASSTVMYGLVVAFQAAVGLASRCSWTVPDALVGRNPNVPPVVMANVGIAFTEKF